MCDFAPDSENKSIQQKFCRKISGDGSVQFRCASKAPYMLAERLKTLGPTRKTMSPVWVWPVKKGLMHIIKAVELERQMFFITPVGSKYSPWSYILYSVNRRMSVEGGHHSPTWEDQPQRQAYCVSIIRRCPRLELKEGPISYHEFLSSVPVGGRGRRKGKPHRISQSSNMGS